MYLSKKASKQLALSILALFLIVGIVLWKTSADNLPLGIDLSSERPNDSAQVTPPDSTPIADEGTTTDSRFTLKRFHRKETKDGELLWEVYGSQGEYVTQENLIIIHDCSLLFMSGGDREIVLTAKQVRIFFDGITVDKAVAQGDVVLSIEDQVKIESQQAIFNEKRQTVTAPGKVSIRGEWHQTNGYRLKGNLQNNQFTLFRNVTTKLEPNKRPKK